MSCSVIRQIMTIFSDIILFFVNKFVVNRKNSFLEKKKTSLMLDDIRNSK